MPRIAVLCTVGLLALLGIITTRWWNDPAAVPDHATIFSATSEMRFAGATTLAQRVRPRRNGFTAVDLVVGAEAVGLPGQIDVEVLEWPSGASLRHSTIPANTLAAGGAWDRRPNSVGEYWLSFGFEPVQDSAGREFVVVLSYPAPGGVDAPGRRLSTLARFPGVYPGGQLWVNGFPQDGTLILRVSAAGTHGQAMQAALENVSRAMPLGRGSMVAPISAGVCSVLFAVALALAVARTPASGAAIWSTGTRSPSSRATESEST